MIFYGFTLEGADKGYLTCVLEVGVIAIVCVLQFVGHHGEPWSVAWWTCRAAWCPRPPLELLIWLVSPSFMISGRYLEGTERETSWGWGRSDLETRFCHALSNCEPERQQTWAWFLGKKCQAVKTRDTFSQRKRKTWLKWLQSCL